MLKKILVALDGSENAEKSIPWVKRYAGRAASQVILFTAVPTEGLDALAIARHVTEAKDYLQRMERMINYLGIPCRTLVRTGRAAETIVKAATREAVDLILMTTRGGSPVKRWLIGGTTEQVLRLSPVPVLTVRSQTPLPHQARVRRIIIPVDGSRRAELVVPWARRLAHFLRAKIIFLHVYPEGPAGLKVRHEKVFDALRKRMLPLCSDLRAEGVKAAFKVQRGDPAERILVYEDRYDLILTTTHGTGRLRRWVFGSVAEKLIHGAGVPVLVYKPAATLSERKLGAAS